MEAGEGEGDVEFQTFIEVPAILDKYKAAAVVADGKSNSEMLLHGDLWICPARKNP